MRSILSRAQRCVFAPRFGVHESTFKIMAQPMSSSKNGEKAVTVEKGGYSMIQDFPARIGYWRVGIPPSGPMDPLALRLANRLVGNPEGAAAVEVTFTGPTLVFEQDNVIALTGARIPATLDGKEVEFWKAVKVRKGQKLVLGDIPATVGGVRTYLAIGGGGFAGEEYLGSLATFPLKFGSVDKSGSLLTAGQVLHTKSSPPAALPKDAALDPAAIPKYGREWEIGVVPGPQEAPDYLRPEDVKLLYESVWTVSDAASRLGVRLIGPKFQWARPNGGEGGSHPSNLHDNAYAIGSINFTGDTGVMLGVDGPSLGGFVCPATIPSSEFWKLGQLKPGDKIRYRKMTLEEAIQSRSQQDQFVKTLSSKTAAASAAKPLAGFSGQALASEIPKGPEHPVGVKYRVAGDQYVMVEYGEMVLDLNLRFRIHELEKFLRTKAKLNGLVDTIPGVRTLLIQYDSQKLRPEDLLKVLRAAEKELPDVGRLLLPSRVWKLPMAFHDKWNREATERYMASFRSEAPYLPDNVEFVAKNNGLSGPDAVRDIVFKASYMCLGLGDVYLGAPCAVPVDPRHRLTVPKYNPARTYTPEGSVGIGGTYMCIYPMESPGGYQLIGRTLPIWNRDANLPNFKNPWLLDMFDQVQFYQVSENELEKLRTDFAQGTLKASMEETQFDVAKYNKFLDSIKDETKAFKQRASAAAAEQSALDAKMQAKASSQKEERGKVLTYLADMAVNGPGAHHPGLNGLKPSKKAAHPPKPSTTGWVPAGKAHSSEAPPRGLKQVFQEQGAAGFAKHVRAHKGALLTCTTMRDAHQSLLATRMRTHDILKICPTTAHVLHNCYSLENWGGATFDVALRFLRECPWDRLEKMRELVPNIPFQMLLRGANAVGYTSYPDNAVYEFCKQAVKSGMDVFRVFDSVNYLPNLQLGIEAVGQAGGIVEGTICYSGNVLNPRGNKYTIDYYLQLGRDLVAAGSHVLCVKDMAGLLTPNAARFLIGSLRREFPDVPIHVHTHDSSNSGVAAMIACIESGADAVDAANDAMSGLTSQPAMGAIVYNFAGTQYDTGIDINEMQYLTDYWELVRPQYEPFDSGQKSAGSDVWQNEIPGGQYTNMFFQAKMLGLESEWSNIKRAYAQANLILGDIIKVTPSSKVVGDLAQFMVAKKLRPEEVVERASELDFPSSVIEFLQGQLGIPLGGFPEPLRSRVLAKAGLKGIEGRPGAVLAPLDFAGIQKKLAEKHGEKFARWQDVNSYAMYPAVFEEYVASMKRFGQVTELSTPYFLEPLAINESFSFTLPGDKAVNVKLVSVEKGEEDAWNVTLEANGVKEVVPIKLKKKGTTPYVLKSAGGAGGEVQEKIVKANPSNAGEVGAPLPGKIVRFVVKPGSEVAKGDAIIVLNSMKMETVISAQANGKISFRVEPGVEVATGQLIAEIK